MKGCLICALQPRSDKGLTPPPSGILPALPSHIAPWSLQDIVSLQSCIVGVSPPFIAPPHLQSLPYCNTIARPLRNIRPPTDPFSLCHTPYNIGDGNIV